MSKLKKNKRIFSFNLNFKLNEKKTGPKHSSLFMCILKQKFEFVHDEFIYFIWFWNLIQIENKRM